MQSLPLSLGQLKCLKRLGIRYNQLTELPTTLSHCTLLDEFIVESNKLQNLPVINLIAHLLINFVLGWNISFIAKFKNNKFKSKSIIELSTRRTESIRSRCCMFLIKKKYNFINFWGDFLISVLNIKKFLKEGRERK